MLKRSEILIYYGISLCVLIGHFWILESYMPENEGINIHENNIENYNIKKEILNEESIIIDNFNPEEYKETFNDDLVIFNNSISYNLSFDKSGSLGSCARKDTLFTDEEIKTNWNYKDYSLCKASLNYLVEVNNNFIQFKCNNNEVSSILLDDLSPPTFGGMAKGLNWIKSTGEDLKNSEYALINCGSLIYSYVFNRFKPIVSQRNQKIRKAISKDSRPLTVLLLVFDSVSRNSAYINLKHTIHYFNNQIKQGKYKEKYSVYDFKYANVANLTTRGNMVQILYGQTEEYHNEFLQGCRPTINNQSTQYLTLQKDALWSYFSSLGYVTLFSMDTIYDYLSLSTGRKIEADHVFTNFWRVAKKAYSYSEFAQQQRCFGDQNAHFYSLNYTLQFLENYKEHNRFGYVHISAAHEDTGNVKTIDDDLANFLDKMLKLFDNKNEDVVLMILGDHGRFNINLTFNEKGYRDHRNPMSFIILNQELEKRLGSKIFLEHNVNNIIGRFDIHATLKSLASSPYKNLTWDSYNKIKQKIPVNDTVSLFHEKISFDRQCKDIGVSDDYCLCKDFIGINITDTKEKKIIDQILSLVTDHLNKQIKDRIQCNEASVSEVISASKFQFNPREHQDSLYKLEFELEGKITANATVHFSTKARADNFKLILHGEFHPYTYFQYEQRVVCFIQIFELHLNNTCKEQLCIC